MPAPHEQRRFLLSADETAEPAGPIGFEPTDRRCCAQHLPDVHRHFKSLENHVTSILELELTSD